MGKGRPRKKFGKMEKQIGLKMTPELLERLELAAEKQEKNFSDFLRQILSEATDRVLGDK